MKNLLLFVRSFVAGLRKPTLQLRKGRTALRFVMHFTCILVALPHETMQRHSLSSTRKLRQKQRYAPNCDFDDCELKLRVLDRMTFVWLNAWSGGGANNESHGGKFNGIDAMDYDWHVRCLFRHLCRRSVFCQGDKSVKSIFECQHGCIVMRIHHTETLFFRELFNNKLQQIHK